MIEIFIIVDILLLLLTTQWQNRHKAIDFEQQILKISQSDIPLSVFQTLPIFYLIKQNTEWR